MQKVPGRYIAVIEQSRYSPSPEVVHHIAHVFGKQVDEVFQDRVPMAFGKIAHAA